MLDNTDYYSPWEWQPIDRIPDGCNEVILRAENGNTQEMCSCDYWWRKKEYDLKYFSFRFT